MSRISATAAAAREAARQSSGQFGSQPATSSSAELASPDLAAARAALAEAVTDYEAPADLLPDVASQFDLDAAIAAGADVEGVFGYRRMFPDGEVDDLTDVDRLVVSGNAYWRRDGETWRAIDPATGVDTGKTATSQELTASGPATLVAAVSTDEATDSMIVGPKCYEAWKSPTAQAIAKRVVDDQGTYVVHEGRYEDDEELVTVDDLIDDTNVDDVMGEDAWVGSAAIMSADLRDVGDGAVAIDTRKDWAYYRKNPEAREKYKHTDDGVATFTGARRTRTGLALQAGAKLTMVENQGQDRDVTDLGGPREITFAQAAQVVEDASVRLSVSTDALNDMAVDHAAGRTPDEVYKARRESRLDYEAGREDMEYQAFKDRWIDSPNG